MVTFIKYGDPPSAEMTESLKNDGVVSSTILSIARKHPTALLLLHWSDRYPSLDPDNRPHPPPSFNSKMFWIEGFGGEWIPLDRSTGCKPDVSTLLPPVVNHPKQTAQESGDLLDMFLDLTGGEEGDGGKKTEEGKGERAKGKGVDGKEGVVVVDASKPPPRARTLPSQMQMQFQGEMNRFLISNPDAEAHQAVTGGYDPHAPPFAFFTAHNFLPLDYDPDLVWIIEDSIYKGYRLCSGMYDAGARPTLALEERIPECIKRCEEWQRWLEWKRGFEGGAVEMTELAGKVGGGLRGAAMELAREAKAKKNGGSGAAAGGANTGSGQPGVSQGKASQQSVSRPTTTTRPTSSQLITTAQTPQSSNPANPPAPHSMPPPPSITNIHIHSSASTPSPAPTAQMLAPNTSSRSATNSSTTKKRKREDVNIETSDQPPPPPPQLSLSPPPLFLSPPRKKIKTTPTPTYTTNSQQKRKRSSSSSSSTSTSISTSINDHQQQDRQAPSKRPRFEVPQLDLLLQPPTPNAKTRHNRPSIPSPQPQEHRVNPFEVPQVDLPSLSPLFAPTPAPIRTPAPAPKPKPLARKLSYTSISSSTSSSEPPPKKPRTKNPPIDLRTLPSTTYFTRPSAPAPPPNPAPKPNPAPLPPPPTPPRRKTAFITPLSQHQQSLSPLPEALYSSPVGPQPALRPPPSSLYRPQYQSHQQQDRPGFAEWMARQHRRDHRPGYSEWMARQHATVAESYSALPLTPTNSLPTSRPTPRPTPRQIPRSTTPARAPARIHNNIAQQERRGLEDDFDDLEELEEFEEAGGMGGMGGRGQGGPRPVFYNVKRVYLPSRGYGYGYRE